MRTACARLPTLIRNTCTYPTCASLRLDVCTYLASSKLRISFNQNITSMSSRAAGTINYNRRERNCALTIMSEYALRDVEIPLNPYRASHSYFAFASILGRSFVQVPGMQLCTEKPPCLLSRIYCVCSSKLYFPQHLVDPSESSSFGISTGAKRA